MYEKDKTLLLVATASALSNNLSIKNIDASRLAEAIGVVHDGFINVIPVRSIEQRSEYIPCSAETNDRHSASVTQVMWCYLGYEACLVVTSTMGLQIFDAHGLELRFSHPCNDSPQGKEHYAKGIANPPGDYLCVGNNMGTLRLFATSDDGSVLFIDRKQTHKAPISDIACFKDILVSGDDDGHLALWSYSPDELIQWAAIHSYGSACTSLKVWKNLVISGYGSGHIRVFFTNMNKKEIYLAVEICAHAKWINSIDVATERGYVLSTSEDSFAKIWQITKGENIVVNHKFSTQIKDCMLVGGKFLTPSGSIFAVSIYDSNIVQCFKM